MPGSFYLYNKGEGRLTVGWVYGDAEKGNDWLGFYTYQ
jgi:hypothetical protein